MLLSDTVEMACFSNDHSRFDSVFPMVFEKEPLGIADMRFLDIRCPSCHRANNLNTHCRENLYVSGICQVIEGINKLTIAILRTMDHWRRSVAK